jgi:hypothetical protein
MWGFKSKPKRDPYAEAVENLVDVLRKASDPNDYYVAQRRSLESYGKPSDVDVAIADLHVAMAEYAAAYPQAKEQPQVLNRLAAKISSLDSRIANRKYVLSQHEHCLGGIRSPIEQAVKGVEAFPAEQQSADCREALARAQGMLCELLEAQLTDVMAQLRPGLFSDRAMERDLLDRLPKPLSRGGASRSSSYRSSSDYSSHGTSTSTMAGGA